MTEFESKIIFYLVPEYFLAIMPFICSSSGSEFSMHPEVKASFCYLCLHCPIFYTTGFHCFSNMTVESEYQNMFLNVFVF